MGAATGQNDAFESRWIGDGGVNCWLETAASFSEPLTSTAQPPKIAWLQLALSPFRARLCPSFYRFQLEGRTRLEVPLLPEQV
jgi:hypothetical protein